MKKRLLTIALAMGCATAQGQTLEECWRAAEQNYPLIRQYGLIEKTTALTVSNIGKGWLPQVNELYFSLLMLEEQMLLK